MIAYRLVNRPVLLIGGGNVASGRLQFLLESNAHITLISSPPLDPIVAHRLITNPDDITYIPRSYTGQSDPIQPKDFAMVLTAIDDNDLSLEVFNMSRKAGVPVNVADVPPCCDFYFGAQLRRGPLQIMVSTGGLGPRIGAMVRDIVARALPVNIEEAIQGVGALRGDLRKRAPGVGGPLGKKRMDWMTRMCDTWGLSDMAVLNNEDTRRKVLDQGWEKDLVVKPRDVGADNWTNTFRQTVFGSWGVGVGGLLTGTMLGAVTTVYILKHYTR